MVNPVAQTKGAKGQGLKWLHLAGQLSNLLNLWLFRVLPAVLEPKHVGAAFLGQKNMTNPWHRVANSSNHSTPQLKKKINNLKIKKKKKKKKKNDLPVWWSIFTSKNRQTSKSMSFSQLASARWPELWLAGWTPFLLCLKASKARPPVTNSS